MLKLKFNDPAEIPEQYKELYEEREGAWFLKLDEKVVQKEKLDEFRQTNIQLMKKLQEYEKTLQQVDIEEYKKLKQKMKEIEEKKLIDAGKIDELVNRRAMEIKQSFEDKIKEYQSQLKEWETKASKYKDRLAKTIIDAEVQKAVLSVAKPKKGAINDILLRARTTWKLDDEGNPLPVDEKGEVIQTEQGPLTFKEWAEQLAEQAPYLFEDSSGGGASGSGGSSSGRPKVISRHDKEAFQKHLKEIAEGKVRVIMD